MMRISRAKLSSRPKRDGKPIASLSVDLDNQWSYMKTHGDRGWQFFPSYLDVVVPRILTFLEERDLTITFFVVGHDAELDMNREPLEAIAAAGHEIGNHSFNHDPWLHLYSEDDLAHEIQRAEEAIEGATGQQPVGFRGPGYSLSEATLRILAQRGYLYDATTLPTFIGPLARAYYFSKSDLTEEARERRGTLFGSFGDGFRPLRPYRWSAAPELSREDLLEIPVTTLPIFKVPFHFSYILHIASFAPRLAGAYFKTALRLCRLSGIQPSMLLHPLDFLGCEDVPELAFFPGMKLRREFKLQIVAEVIDLLCRRYAVMTMRGHALELADGSRSSVAEPSFGPSHIP